MRLVGTEEQLYEQVARWLNLKHPELVFHFDLSGLWTPSHRLRNLYGRLNKRAWPDLFVAKPHGYPAAIASGLFIELKREGTRIKKRDGSWASPHIAEQAAMHEQLREQGYEATFAVGLGQAMEVIEHYLRGEL